MAHTELAWQWPARPSRSHVKDDISKCDTQVLIIGGGGAGLAVAACLRSEGVDHILLDKSMEPGEVWRYRYDRLHLHHPTDQMHLPYMPFPPNVGEWVSKDELADYMLCYARLMHVNWRGGMEVLDVRSICSQGGPSDAFRWEVIARSVGGAAQCAFRACHVLFCLGPTGSLPRIPEVSGSYEGLALHSGRYKTAKAHGLGEGDRVLVVGFGNSAVEVTYDLVEQGCAPTILIRSPKPLVTRSAFRLFYDWRPWMLMWCKYVPLGFLVIPFLLMFLELYFKFDLWWRYGNMSHFGIVSQGGSMLLRFITFCIEPRKGFLTKRLISKYQAPTCVDGTFGDDRGSIMQLVQDGVVRVRTTPLSHFVGGKKLEFGSEGDDDEEEYDAIIWCTGFNTGFGANLENLPRMSKHMKKGLAEAMPFSESPAHPGLWLCVGGFEFTRNGAISLAHRLARSVLGLRAKPWPYLETDVLGPIIRIPKITAAIHVIAVFVMCSALLPRSWLW